MEEETRKLHIVMLPWLAMGHLLPFFELSKRLALKNLQISFFTTPSNILRLPSIPQTLTPFLTFIPCSLPAIDNLPSTIENTVDLHSEAARPLLNQAYAAFEHHLIAFLSDPSRPKPNWIIYDFAATTWAPTLASRFNINSAFFSLFNAAVLSFFSHCLDCNSPEKLTKIPDGIPFPTTVAFRPFEARQIHSMLRRKPDRTESQPQIKQLMLIRTCKEFENKWLDLLGGRYTPVGFLPPSSDEEESETWMRIHQWLDAQEDSSVIYAAFGSEARLTREQIDEIGLGLEQSGLPFFWALRLGSPPQGFEDRTAGRGLVWRDWVPQARLLAHPAIGGFLTHGGWNSVVEGMAAGVAMVVLPMMFEQGLNARHLVESGYGVEVVRDDEDGSFSGEEIWRKLRMVMVEEEGEELRKKVRKGKEVFGSEELQEEYIVEVVKKLRENREDGSTTGLIV
ncbi:putative UDP-rhamnose:rhamnosyltransferase 1 [Phalaenopsis equestris]|uniref:putative UDP-rhamnose:rhamnosyltransferase 1 n=1 Tax=Phalaenopsis equestris TaxID=78828 RepID=UPI0009E53537|nr:putative UDP-rhamnose:rhamnosyltransferase 1 [Phalaenopsis equestris]XP_020589668.1 putative UDP-rhamnose:rhamnosyltransferase 1 [Phalaenopsis equestris]